MKGKVLRWVDPTPQGEAEPAPPLRLDIGCGRTTPEGWTGIDAIDFGQKHVHDVRKGLPWLADSCVDEVRSSHFVEHLTGAERALATERARLSVDEAKAADSWLRKHRRRVREGYAAKRAERRDRVFAVELPGVWEPDEARALAERGLKLASTNSDRERFRRLTAALVPPAGSVKSATDPDAVIVTPVMLTGWLDCRS